MKTGWSFNNSFRNHKQLFGDVWLASINLFITQKRLCAIPQRLHLLLCVWKSQHLIQNENWVVLEVSVSLAVDLLPELVHFQFEAPSAKIMICPDISQWVSGGIFALDLPLPWEGAQLGTYLEM